MNSHILIVDDEQSIIDLLRLVLEREGLSDIAEAATAADGRHVHSRSRVRLAPKRLAVYSSHLARQAGCLPSSRIVRPREDT